MLAALLLASLPLVPDPDGASAYFEVRHPQVGEVYEVLIPKPDPLRGCTGVRFTMDHETTVDAWAQAQVFHPGSGYYLTARYWFWQTPEPDYATETGPVAAFSKTYYDVMPPLAPGMEWSKTSSGSSPSTQVITHPAGLRHFMKRGTVKMYLVPDVSGSWPYSTHGFQWGHAVNFDLLSGLIEYRSHAGNWYVP